MSALPGSPPTEHSNAALTRRLVALAWRFRGDCLASLFLSVALLVLAISGLQFLGVGIDLIRHTLDATVPAPKYPFGWVPPAAWSPEETLLALAASIVMFALVRAVLTYSYNMATARLTQGKIVPLLREEVYAKLQRLSFRFYDAHASGSIFNRVTGDVQNTRLFVDGVLLQGVMMVITLTVYVVFMVQIHLGLTVACLATTPLLWGVSHFYSGVLRPGYMKNRELYDRLVLDFSENIRGMQTVKGFSAEDRQRERFEEANRSVTTQQRKIFRDLSIFTPLTHFLSQANLVVLLAYGGYLTIRGEVPLGTGMVVFAGLLQQFSGQIANISGIANSVQQALAGARRVFEVLDAPVEVSTRPGAVKPRRLSGRVRFEGVTFGFTPENPVLREVTFETRPGQVVGIFGPTGSGKSTLLSLVPRFYDPQAGRILVDDHDLRDLDVDEYRRQIGIVYQESFLFSNTVAANIAFGNPKATQAQVEAAARVASAHEFITSLPRGYETVLGESGVDLSGGQRQRLALARALLLEPPILILDDPTASIDPKTEHEIVTALRSAMEGRTAFVVSNRLSLLRRADTILVLSGGRLVQQGTHEELLRQPGPYQQTAMLQLMDLHRSERGAA